MNRLALSAAACVLLSGAPGTPASPLRFSIPEGGVQNEFFRDGPVAAHVVLRPGAAPRLLVAFPAGNSGVAMWLEAERDFSWGPVRELRGERARAPDGSSRFGVSAEVTAQGARLVLRRALMGSIRTLRGFEDSGTVPPGVETAPKREGRALIWDRPRLDGGSGYRLRVELLEGELSAGGEEPVVMTPAPGGQLRLRVTALTGDPPLTPLSAADLLTADAARDTRLQRVLEFLSFEDKLLAGSWRFDTYFGRDTLMSLCLLSRVMRPGLAETGFRSVLDRLNAAGEVAHEEDIGEFAVLRRMEARQAPGDAPIYDYRMIDDDFMLAIVSAAYLLDSTEGRRRAEDFLAARGAHGRPNGAALVANFRFVVDAAGHFARSPRWRNLVALKAGESAGNWRDSDAGLGHGRYPYDVNGVLVPAALTAIARLVRSGILDPYLDAEAAGTLGRAGVMAGVWMREAPPLFEVRLRPETARADVGAYAIRAGVDAGPAVEALGSRGVTFRAVALDAAGRPVPVLNSDESYALLLLDLPAGEVERIASTLVRPFPAGLLTGAGLVVANPAFAPAALQPEFGKNRYHGTVVWSWHQSLLRAGLERQLGRSDLPAGVIATLADARSRLLAVMQATRSLRGSELWTWSWSEGGYTAEPFGQAPGDETESNAAQLWSTVQLAWPQP